MAMAPAASSSTSGASASSNAKVIEHAKRPLDADEVNNIFDDTGKDDDVDDNMPKTGLPLFPSAQGIFAGGKVAEADDKGLFDDLGPTKEELAPGPAAPKALASIFGAPLAAGEKEAEEKCAGGAPAVDNDMDMFG